MTRPDKAAKPVPDLLKRDFSAKSINEKWCGDLTEIPTDEGKLYLATVEDLAARRLAGFAIGEHHDAELATTALQTAAAVLRRLLEPKEYTAETFAEACRRLGVTQSMGRVGLALDNAAAESFNSTLEFELLSRRRFATKAGARPEVAAFIDRYNLVRRHSSCEMHSPVDYEAILAERAVEGAEGEKAA